MARRGTAEHRGDSTVTDLNAMLESSRRVRRPLEPQWFLNLAFFNNRQWVAFDGYKVYEPQLDEGRIKLTDNRITPIVRTEIAKMTKSRPTWVGVPRSAEDEDIAAARMAEHTLEWEWTNLGMVPKLREALLWSRTVGGGFLKACWDPELGDSTEVLVDRAGKLLKDSREAPMKADKIAELPQGFAEEHGVQRRRIARGDIRLSVPSPLGMFPDPLAGADGLESAGWVIEENVYSPDYVYSHYPEARELGLEPDADVGAGSVQSRMPGWALGINPTDARKTGICLRELWHLPTSEFPHGKRCVWTKTGTLLHEDANPYPWLPYVMFRGIVVPGRFWPGAIVEHLMSPQIELNKVTSQIAENAERIGNPPLLEPSTYNGDDWEGLPGERIQFDPTGDPTAVPRFMEVAELPAYVQNRIGQIESSLREISGQHEITHGQVPAGVTAASAINLLQEQDDTRLGPDIGDMEEALAGLGRRVIWLVANHYDENRVIRIAGDDGRWEFRRFRRGVFRGDQGIEIQTGSSMPRSKAAQQAAAMELLRMLSQNPNVQLDAREMRRFSEAMEVGGLDRIFASVAGDERQVAREHLRMQEGDDLGINEYDDDQQHVASHTAFMKTATFEELGPQDRKRFVDHLNAHRVRLQQQADKLQVPPPTAALAGMPPTAPTPGQPSPSSAQSSSQPVGGNGAATLPAAA